MAPTVANPAGAAAALALDPSAPHPTIVLSLLSARLWRPPAATATTAVNPGGTVLCPDKLFPQATTVPVTRLLFCATAGCITVVARMAARKNVLRFVMFDFNLS